MHAQSRLTLWDSTDCSPPGSSVHEILHARILEWVAMPSSRGSSRPRDGTQVSCSSCIAGGFFNTRATWETLLGKLGASLVAQMVKNLPALWEIWVCSLHWEDPLEKGMAMHSSILAWRISWTEELNWLQFKVSERVGCD